ncbi:hypothetical protein CHH28_12245 [Bacterioplanes sanyensis]|uniref:Uncharacterized protein n=1 Tax=Bacterioplanes sanyensis TaxID=1249553 RepID=A0A222FK23_9GAMM|nr:hypothetical protein CHH28_12245 [Bacterioplanes sanyensis]
MYRWFDQQPKDDRDELLLQILQALDWPRLWPMADGLAVAMLYQQGMWGLDRVLLHQQRHIGAIELQPDGVGDFFQGLIQVLASQFVFDDELVAGLDQAIRGWDEDTFLAALPALRLAFTQLAPKQGRQLYLRLFDQPMPHEPLTLTDQQLRYMAKVEAQVQAQMQLWGLS